MIRQYTNKEILELIGENERHYRKTLNLTQEELAINTGLSLSTIQKFENGEANISIHNLLNIMRATGQIENVMQLFPEQPINPYSYGKKKRTSNTNR